LQQRITYYERQKIEFLLKHNQSARNIADALGRDHTVISREINRNGSDYLPYNAKAAQSAADRKAKHTNTRKLHKDKQLYRYVVDGLKEGWSPQQIAGRLKKHPPKGMSSKYISHEQIYEYIYNDGRDECFNRLFHYLRRAQPRRQPRYSRKHKKKTIIPDRVSIHSRPETINQREEYGHWESDTVCFGRSKQAISVQYERKSQYVTISQLYDHGAQETIGAIVGQIETLSPRLWQSITFDNGGEAAQHTKLKRDYDMATYFCDGYKSWQKGGVENMNGLIRQYLPKKINLDGIDDGQLYEYQERLNNRPRKSLNYLTPNEIVKQIT
jgi:IS30 family transposase